MYSLLKPLLFSLDPETAHSIVKWTGKIIPPSLLRAITHFESPRLTCKIGSTSLSNPIGLAAGFDKNGELVNFMGSIGFGFVEIGSVTAHPCLGNPKPRLFRLPKDESLINRLGLPNKGASWVSHHLSKQELKIPIGINIASTPVREGAEALNDYLQTFERLHPYADYLVFNLSCPNTKGGADFEKPQAFKELAGAINACRKKLGVTKPLLIKLSPDLAIFELRRTVEIALEHGFDGFILTNTTSDTTGLQTASKTLSRIGQGGISGQALGELSNRQIQRVYEIVKGTKIIIGVGGILSFEDLLDKLSAGASLFQIYTGLVYRGPFFARHLAVSLDRLCQSQGVKNYRELIGVK